MIGDDPATRDAEQAALARGIDLGLTLIDTAEIYGDGRSERLVGEVIKGRRDEVFLVSKIKPDNAGEMTMMLHCEKSLQRLGSIASTSICCTGRAGIRSTRSWPGSRSWSMRG